MRTFRRALKLNVGSHNGVTIVREEWDMHLEITIRKFLMEVYFARIASIEYFEFVTVIQQLPNFRPTSLCYDGGNELGQFVVTKG